MRDDLGDLQNRCGGWACSRPSRDPGTPQIAPNGQHWTCAAAPPNILARNLCPFPAFIRFLGFSRLNRLAETFPMQFFSWLVFLSLLPSTPIATPASAGPSPVAGTPRVTSLFVAVGQDPWLASRAEAERILDEVRDVYANCFSYRDSGKVESVFVVPDQEERTVVKPFETAFSRDEGLFRFEYRDRAGEYEWNKCVVWSDGEVDPPFTVSTTTTWAPRIDGDIPDSAFGFEVPGK